MKLKNHSYSSFVRPIFDIAGLRELDTTSPLRIATPIDCFNQDFLLQPYSYTESDMNGLLHTTYWPSEKGANLQFSCITSLIGASTPLNNFASYYRALPTEACTTTQLTLNGTVVRSSGGFCVQDSTTANYAKTYDFKRIPSYIEHKSPTDEEYGIEL